jgi:hypothetical protein
VRRRLQDRHGVRPREGGVRSSRPAGYTKGSNGFFEKNGKEIKLSIITNGGYSDWVADMQIMAKS